MREPQPPNSLFYLRSPALRHPKIVGAFPACFYADTAKGADLAPGVLLSTLNGSFISTHPAYDDLAPKPWALNMSRANLLSLFDSFPQLGRDIAVVETRGYRRQKLTYARLHALSLFWSHALSHYGIRPGDRILLWAPNSSNWIACFWAILLRRAIVVPMDPAASVAFVQSAARDAQVKLILRDRLQPELPNGPPSLVIDDLQALTESPQATTDAQIVPGDPPKRSTVAQILFTSGTTSDPRGVVLTHGNFLANLEPLETGINEYRKYERWFHPLRFVSLVPLSHVFGQFMTLFVPPLLGATVVFENSPHPGEIVRTIKRERATALIAVPRMLDSLRSALELDIDRRGWRTWFTSAYATAAGEPFLRRVWRFRRLHRRLGWKFWAFISGGAALSSQTEEFFKRIGYAVVQGYGMTETASLISLNHPFRATEGSVGKILPGREFRLAEDGEILVRGENVSSGYWEKGELRQGPPEDEGWLHTGDLGELDVAGNLRFRGRKKNVIVTPAGLNIYPEDLEAALRQQSPIRDSVVLPLASGANAEPLAVLLLQSPDNTLARAAIDSANSALAEYQRIRHWLVWPEPDFPRTPTGKPRLPLISARAAELLGRTPEPGISPALTGTEPTDLSSLNLKDLSSLDRVELLSTLEQRYNVELNETQFANAQSFSEIQQLLAQPAARRSDYVYPRWTQRAPVRLIRLLIYYALTWPATLLLGHPRIRGLQHLRNLRGPALFVANHTTRRADIGLILFALPPRFRHRLATAMGGEFLQEFRHPPRGWFFAKRWLWQLSYFLVVSLFNVFPLPQLSGFRESFRFAGESADRGYSLLVFPEGIVNDRNAPDMIPFQTGIGLLAENLRLPIVPLRLDGVWQMKQEHRRLARLDEITVHIGAPVTFPPNTPPAEIAFRLQALVRSL
jgi:long-chain acyl-CoA synthetase